MLRCIINVLGYLTIKRAQKPDVMNTTQTNLENKATKNGFCWITKYIQYFF